MVVFLFSCSDLSGAHLTIAATTAPITAAAMRVMPSLVPELHLSLLHKQVNTGLLALPPDAGHLAPGDVPVTLHVLPPVVHAAAPRGHVLPVVHLGPLLTEHGHLVPHEGECAAVNLSNEKNFSVMLIGA